MVLSAYVVYAIIRTSSTKAEFLCGSHVVSAYYQALTMINHTNKSNKSDINNISSTFISSEKDIATSNDHFIAYSALAVVAFYSLFGSRHIARILRDLFSSLQIFEYNRFTLLTLFVARVYHRIQLLGLAVAARRFRNELGFRSVVLLTDLGLTTCRLSLWRQKADAESRQMDIASLWLIGK